MEIIRNIEKNQAAMMLGSYNQNKKLFLNFMYYNTHDNNLALGWVKLMVQLLDNSIALYRLNVGSYCSYCMYSRVQSW